MGKRRITGLYMLRPQQRALPERYVQYGQKIISSDFTVNFSKIIFEEILELFVPLPKIIDYAIEPKTGIYRYYPID